MKKEELLNEVSVLKTKLYNSEQRIERILQTATNLIKWTKSAYNWFTPHNKEDKINNMNELFFEIWKLISFRDESRLEKREENDIKRKQDYIIRLESELNSLTRNQWQTKTSTNLEK